MTRNERIERIMSAELIRATLDEYLANGLHHERDLEHTHARAKQIVDYVDAHGEPALLIPDETGA